MFDPKDDMFIVETLEDYLDVVLNKLNYDKLTYNVRSYRGQTNSSWSVNPSALRQNGSSFVERPENELLRELKLEVPSEFNNLENTFEVLVHAQHYGLPTRLLDVSLNPLVALFFACEDKSYAKDHVLDDYFGKVFVYDFDLRREKYSDSDTISIICNMCKLSRAEQGTLFDFLIDNSHYFGDLDSDYRHSELNDKLRKQDIIDRLIYFIKKEKPYFINSIDVNSLLDIYIVHPPKFNKRLIAQSGAFIVSAFDSSDFNHGNIDHDIVEINIPDSSKEIIINSLDRLGINKKTLFPDIEHAARYIRARC